MRSPRGAKFQDYKNEIIVKVIKIDTVLVRERQNLNILLEIDNQSEKDWEDPTYEIQYLSPAGELLNVENDKDYQLVISAKRKVNSSIKIPVYQEYQNANIEVKLMKMQNDWY